MRSRSLPDVATVCAAAVLAALLTAGLSHPLQNLNEGLYARVAQEMLESHAWIVPTLDGVPYLEKPPLLYWITAASFALFGPHEAAARAAPWLGTVLMLSATAWFAARRFGSRVALFAALILASSPIVVGLTRTLLFDSLFAGLLAWSVVLAHEAMAQVPRRALMRGAYAVVALAMLAKGLAAIVLFAGIAAAAVALAPRGTRAWRIRLLADPWALAIFAALALPWHVAAALREPSFAGYYFWNEHVGRFLGARWPHDYHTGAWWYYLPRIAGYAFPWILLFIVPPPRPTSRAGADAGESSAPPMRGFVWAWLLVPLAIFSLAENKGDYYMVVGMPPLALVLAHRLDAVRHTARMAFIPVLVMAMLAGSVVVLARHRLYELPPHTPALVAAAFGVLTAAATAFALRHARAGAVALASFGIVMAVLFSGFLEANESMRSARTLARVIRELHPAQVYVYREYEGVSALPFYLRHVVGVVDSRSRDLVYGLRVSPHTEQFPAPRTFVAASDETSRTTVLVVPDNRAMAFRASALAWRFDRVGRVGPFELYRRPPGERLAVGMGPIRAAR